MSSRSAEAHGWVWGDKIDPKFDCHYFDPTCAAGGSTQRNRRVAAPHKGSVRPLWGVNHRSCRHNVRLVPLGSAGLRWIGRWRTARCIARAPWRLRCPQIPQLSLRERKCILGQLHGQNAYVYATIANALCLNPFRCLPAP